MSLQIAAPILKGSGFGVGGTGLPDFNRAAGAPGKKANVIKVLTLSFALGQTGAAYADEIIVAPRTMAGPDSIPPGLASTPHRAVRDDIEQHSVNGALASVVQKIKQTSGLTWQELADVFAVTRRTLHFWASGKPINAPNQARLRRTHALLSSLMQPSQGSVRDILWESVNGATLIELLTEQQFDSAAALVRDINERSVLKPHEASTGSFTAGLLIEPDYVGPELTRSTSPRKKRRPR